jgi:hypothetical protein
MTLTKIEKPKGKGREKPPPRSPIRIEEEFARIEAEISLNLKLCSRALGLSPERLLTLAARMREKEYPGMTLGEALALYQQTPRMLWVDLKITVGRKGNGCDQTDETAYRPPDAGSLNRGL